MTEPLSDPLDDAIHACLARADAHVHLLGICGVGMAGLARLLLARGLRVSGCDTTRGALADWLAATGIRVLTGHDPDHLAGVDWVIRSTAVPDSAPEILEARARGVPVFRRGEVLPVVLRSYDVSVAVSGTHGKTSTTGFITQMLRHAGRDPAWCIGGEVPCLNGVAGAGRGTELVVEADESDGTVTRYRPHVAVVTNIEFDHMEHFADVAAFEACFRRFMQHAAAGVVYCLEDPRARALAAAIPHALSYGFHADAQIRGTDLVEAADRSTFTLWLHAQRIGQVALPVAGAHHARNALAAAAVGYLLGLDAAAIVAGLGRVQLPRRRFETVVARPELTVISDYAHHPTEIAAIVRTARGMPHTRMRMVYQPHRYTRTRALGPDFPPAFAGVDDLLLLPVYAASEAPLRGGSIWDLYSHCRSQAAAQPADTAAAARIPVPRVARNLKEAWAWLRRDLRAGDLLLITGAGDVDAMAQWAAAELGDARAVPPAQSEPDLAGLALSPQSAVRRDEPLADKVNYGLGGMADVFADIGTEADLVEILRWTHTRGLPLTVMGGGFNLLPSDLGVRGVSLRLAGATFMDIREIAGGLVVVGAGVTLAQMLDWLEARQIGGFEFLEGIPGTLGGGMQMNAGAWGEGLGDHLAWIRCLNHAGEACIVPRDGLDLGYRRCGFLRERVLVEAAFTAQPGDPAAIAARRLDIRQRRAWMAGYRSAGSYFKNPEGAKAGKLLELAGMHGRRVGGAVIGTHHANFVITEGAATAADVQALTEIGRADVLAQSGIALEPEVKFLA